jgi:hypothetical protein
MVLFLEFLYSKPNYYYIDFGLKIKYFHYKHYCYIYYDFWKYLKNIFIYNSICKCNQP